MYNDFGYHQMKSGHLLLINDQQTSLNLSDACLDDFIDKKGISLLGMPLLKNPREEIFPLLKSIDLFLEIKIRIPHFLI